MPLELLRWLATENLPTTLTAEHDIDRAHVLHAAGHIACTFSAPGLDQPFARVLAITKEGTAALALEDLLRRHKGAA